MVNYGLPSVIWLMTGLLVVQIDLATHSGAAPR
jgi:hypothetical protein